MKRNACLLLSLLLMLGMCSACAAPVGVSAAGLTVQSPAPTPSPPVTAEPGPAATPPPSSFSSYDQVYTLISSLGRYGGAKYLRGKRIGAAFAEAGMAIAAQEPTPMPAPTENAGDSYSGTNVQVAGVDEGDIVKTDGKYIYILRDCTLLILRAEKDGVTKLSETELDPNGRNDVSAQQPDGGWHSRSRTPLALYLVDGTVVVVCANYESYEHYDAKNDRWTWDGRDYVTAYLWDVSDPTAPVCAASFGQDGYYSDSRVYGGKLYLVSNWRSYDYRISEPRSYVPCLYVDEAEKLMPPERISRLPQCDDAAYLVVQAIDIAAAETVASRSILGGGSATLYMNEKNLYLAQQEWREDVTATYTESVYTVRECLSGYCTNLTRIGLDSGDLTISATGSVRGWLIGQFAMDEFDGHFRVVTTANDSVFKTYTDEQFCFTNYVYPDENQPQSSGLYVLDSDLNTVGSVTGLGETERVYSVRFQGDTGYFVTFRQTDPLFAVDLRDPENPTVLSALKIPGFSQYLHGYGDGLLLGLGYTADEKTGWRENVKLSMFDISDPRNVTEAAVAQLSASYCQVCDDHHAALIDTEKNLIGFPTESEYLVYAYENGAFTRTAAFQLDGWSWNTRGLYIGDRLYIVDHDAVYTVDMDAWQLLGKLSF